MINKKLYIYIYIYIALIIFALLLFSCEEKKAKDTIKKAIDEIVTEEDKNTVKPQSTPQGSSVPTNTGGDTEGEGTPTNTGSDTPGASSPLDMIRFAVSSYRVRVGKAAKFTKLTGYTYALKTATKGVTLSGVPGDTTKGQVTSTEAVSGIIIVGTKDGTTIECNPIEFFLLRVANKKALQDEITKAVAEHGNDVDLNYIDTSAITDMKELFQRTAFNGDISKWDVSSVETMEAIFFRATSFNQSLNSWTVSEVRNMSYMFSGATSFNQSLNSWDVSKVENMNYMFNNATAFNQNLNTWTVSEVTDMIAMFDGATSFNQSLNTWTVSKVENMHGMFRSATAFNQPLDKWNVSSVENMGDMFYGATSFNQDISGWAEKSDRNIANMFHGASAMLESYKPSWAR